MWDRHDRRQQFENTFQTGVLSGLEQKKPARDGEDDAAHERKNNRECLTHLGEIISRAVEMSNERHRQMPNAASTSPCRS